MMYNFKSFNLKIDKIKKSLKRLFINVIFMDSRVVKSQIKKLVLIIRLYVKINDKS